MTARQRWTLLVSLALVGIALRVAAIHVLDMPSRYVYDASGYLTLDGDRGDAREYEGRGWQLLHGGDFWAIPSGDGDSPPGYPLIVAACYAVTGRNFMALLYLNAIIGGLAAIPAYLLGRRLFSPTAGLVAAAGVIADPLLVFWSAQILTETVSVMLILIVLFLILRLGEPGCGARRAVAAGSLMAAPILIRNVFMLLPLLVVARAVTTFRSGSSTRLCMLTAAAMCGLIVLIANGWAAHERPAAVRTQWQLLVNRDNLGRGGHIDVAVRSAKSNRGGGLGREEQRRIEEEAADYARQAWLPLLLCRTWGSRMLAFWRIVPGTGSVVERGLYAVSSLVLFILAAFGSRRAWVRLPERREDFMLLFGFVLLTTLVHCAIVAAPRYRIPLHPILWLFAGYAVSTARRNPSLSQSPYVIPCAEQLPLDQWRT